VDYKVIANLFLLLFLGVADNQMIAALFPVLRGSLKVSVAVVGLIVVVYAVMAAVASFVSGALSDHYGRRKFLLGGAVVFALASGLSSQSRTFGELFLARALTGLAAGTISTCSIALRRRLVSLPHPRQSRWSDLVRVFCRAHHWRASRRADCRPLRLRRVFLFFGALALVVAGVSVTLPREKLDPQPSARKVRSTVHAFRNFLSRSDIVAALCVAFLVSAGLVGFITYIGQWLSDHFRIPTGGITLVFMAGGLASLLGAPLGGIFADRWGKRSVSIASNVLLALAVGLVPFLHWGFWLFVVFGATGLGAAFRQGPITALMTEMVPAHQRGFFIALRNIASQLGIGSVVFLGGLLYQRHGYAAVTTLCAAMTMLVAVLLATHIVEPHPVSVEKLEVRS